MIGWTVKPTSRSGWRRMRLRLRLATRPCPRRRSGRRSPPRPPPRLGGVTGERQEDIVEGRAPQRDVVDSDAGFVEPADGLGDRASAIAQRNADERRPRRRAARPRSRRARRPPRSPLPFPRAEPPAARRRPCAFSSRGCSLRDHVARGRSPRSGRRAGRPRRGTASSAARWCRSVTSASIASHSADAAAEVEAGRRLVEEEHGRSRDERGGEVETPPHASRYPCDGPVARVGEAEVCEQLCRALARRAAAEVVEPPDHLEVLEAGQILVDGGVLAGEPDLLANAGASRTTSKPTTPRRPGIRSQQRREDADRRRLAGSVRAEQPQDAPASTRRSKPHSALTSP